MHPELQIYKDLLLFWNSKVNLISKKDIQHIDHRHIENSLKLHAHIQKKHHHILDIGSGGGFPAIPLAIMHGYKISLIEKDQKKCSFLREVLSKCSIDGEVINDRVENCSIVPCSIITSRAFAPLDILFDLCYQQLIDKDIFLLKGNKYDDEIENAKKNFAFSVFLKHKDNEGCILGIRDVMRKSWK